MTVTGALPAPSRIWPSPALKKAHSAFTVCPRKSSRSEQRTTTFSKKRRKEPWTSPPGWKWFLGCLGRAIDGAQVTLSAVLAKARFWEAIAGVAMNGRQRLVLNRLLDGFEGKLTTSKYAKLAKCSQDTALRDILSLVYHGILVRNPGGGRSTSYDLSTFRGTRGADDDHGTISTPSGRSKPKPG